MSFSVDKILRKAESCMKAGELAESEKLYKHVLSKFPKNKRAVQGYVKLKSSNISKTSVTSKSSEQIFQELQILFEHKQFKEVLSKLKPLLSMFPNNITLYNLQGLSNEGLKKYDAAIVSYENIVKINSNYLEGYNSLGNVQRQKGCLEAAVSSYKRAIEISPNYFEGHNNLGNVLQEKGDFEVAIESYKRAIKINPDSAECYNNMGNSLKNRGGLDAAIASYKKALHLNPDYAEAHNNLGIALKNNGEINAAIDSYKQAIKITPDYADAHQNLSFAFLNTGRLKEGLDQFEWRWKTSEFLSKKRQFSQPLWDGVKNLKGRRILLWGEQGPQDMTIWSSCLPYLSSLAGHCILECPEKLIPLYARSFPDVEVRAEKINCGNSRDDFDFHLPLGSLFRHFIPEISRDTKVNAFLAPDPARVNFWKVRLNSLGTGPCVGISWKSPVMKPVRLPNYTQISDWIPVLSLPDITFINLQSTGFADDLNKIQNELGVKVHHFDDLDHYDNLDDVAALSAALDIVVSVSTAVSAIAAGVGTPTKLVAWRQSPWNNLLLAPRGPFVDAFERNTWEPWDEVFNAIAQDITKYQETGCST